MKIRLCLLFGGKSVEHEVSIISALQAAQNLDSSKYDIIPVYISKDGRFYTGKTLLDIESFGEAGLLPETAREVMFYRAPKSAYIAELKGGMLSGRKTQEIDVALPVVHGTNVEDGALQGFLRTLGIPYAGCEVLASAVGMEKAVMKMVLESHGIPVLPYIYFTSAKWQNFRTEILSEIEKKLGYPVIVKPSNLGSSIGIKPAKDRSELVEAVDYARQYALKILVEKKISNLTEINCAVIGDNETQQASACERPLSGEGILSFADKYLNGGGNKGMSGLDRELPAKISQELENKISDLAKAVFRALDANGVARVDFLIDNDTGEVYANEINTIPGSLSFYLFEPLGIPYSELLDRLISLSLKRQRENAGIEYDYKTNILSLKGKRGKKI